jgi:hypothetical protein
LPDGRPVIYSQFSAKNSQMARNENMKSFTSTLHIYNITEKYGLIVQGNWDVLRLGCFVFGLLCI